ncbi:MAG: hypothetical protein ACRC46_08595 [Thermoguttaceae bacterium]
MDKMFVRFVWHLFATVLGAACDVTGPVSFVKLGGGASCVDFAVLVLLFLSLLLEAVLSVSFAALVSRWWNCSS